MNPASLLGHRVDVVSGHDEYWSDTMRNAYESARSAGVNLAFLGGNIGFWRLRYANEDRTLIEYRSAALDPETNPELKTVQFSQVTRVSRPACELLGIGDAGATNSTDPPRSYAVTPSALSNSWFKGTGLSPGAAIFDSVGYEWDNVRPGCAVPALRVLLHFAGLTGVKGSAASADSVTYTAASDARVISDGSMQMVSALDDFGHRPHADVRVQRLVTNVFDDLGATPSRGAPSGRPVPEAPVPRALVSSPVRLSWSTPPTRLQSYQLLLDVRPPATITASPCRRGSCTVRIRLSQGKHRWTIDGSDALGNSVAGSLATFTVDNTPPARFSLRSPRSGAILAMRWPAFAWTASHDRAAGIAHDLIVVDGEQVVATTLTSYKLRRSLRDGWQTWYVVAVDRAGNQRATRTRRFRVR